MADSWIAALKDWASGAVLTETDLDQEVRDRFTAVFNALTADNSADSDIWHGHKSGTLASRPAAAHAGRTYLATDLGVTFTDFGTRWEIGTVHPRIAEWFFDEFMLSRAGSFWQSNAAGETAPWAVNFTSSGRFVTFGNADLTRLGMSTGTTSGSTATLTPLSNGTIYQMDLASDRVPAYMYCRYATSATTNGTVLFGLADGGTVTPNGMYFKRIDTGTVGNWLCISRAGGVDITSTDSGTAGNTAYHDFEIFVDSLTQVRFFIDGVLEATHTPNATLQTTNLTIQHYITNSAAQENQLNLDRIDWIARR